MTDKIISQTISLDDLPSIIEHGSSINSTYLRAVSFLRDETFWRAWAIRALLALAVGHILSGIIFFFAFNWNDLSGMTKFAVVGGGIFICLAAWCLAKLDSAAGQVFGIGATVGVGVMFAVLGQVYQTPAMLHKPFVFWALLTFPFALASRNLAHWMVWLTVLTVALSTYANSGLRLAGNEIGANLLNLTIAAMLVGGLVCLDKIAAPHRPWLRAEWFRVVLVLGGVGFAFAGFTESFWDHGSPLWVIAFVILGCLLGYLYKLKPSLSTLSLASFGLFSMTAQFGFKLFDGSSNEVGALFIVFIWLGGLTVPLVAAFRHFLNRFPAAKSSTTVVNDNVVETISVSGFSKHMGLDESEITALLSKEAERQQPWYMIAFLGIAGFLTAILGAVFFGFFVSLVIGYDDEMTYGVVGLFIFGLSILLRRKIKSPYAQHIMNTLIIIGGMMTSIGFGFTLRDFDAVLAMIFGLSLVVLLVVKDPILEFLAAAALIAVIGTELYHLRVPMIESLLLIISTSLGIFFLTRPLGTRLLQSAGTACLMAPAVLGIALVHVNRWDDLADISRFDNDWVALSISLIVLLSAVFYLNRARGLSDIKPPLFVLVPLVFAAAIIPLGGASALLLILTGYILGSRSLAIVGTLLQIYFLTMFYYDLSLDLLTKSIVLFVSGLIFLGVWYFVQRRSEVIL